MQDVVKVMIKPLLAVTAEKGIALKLQPSALKLLAKQGYDLKWGLAHFVDSCRPSWKILWQRCCSVGSYQLARP